MAQSTAVVPYDMELTLEQLSKLWPVMYVKTKLRVSCRCRWDLSKNKCFLMLIAVRSFLQRHSFPSSVHCLLFILHKVPHELQNTELEDLKIIISKSQEEILWFTFITTDERGREWEFKCNGSIATERIYWGNFRHPYNQEYLQSSKKSEFPLPDEGRNFFLTQKGI